MLSSSTLSPLSQPWRRLRTTIPLCSLLLSRLTSIRSSMRSRNCTTLMWPRSTHWSGTTLCLHSFMTRSWVSLTLSSSFPILMCNWWKLLMSDSVWCFQRNHWCTKSSTVMVLVKCTFFSWTVFSSGLMVKRRLTYVLHQTTMLWMLPTK